MTALWVLLIILIILVALWLLPLRLLLRYDHSGGTVALKIGLISIRIYPPKPKKGAKKSKSEKPKEPEAPEKSNDASSGIGGKLPLFRQLLELGVQALHCLLRHLTVTDMTLELAVATRDKDPALAAIKYGAGWSAVGALTPFLEQHLRIKSRKINVILDPNAAEDRILASGTLHIFLGELLRLALHYGIRGIRIYLRSKKKGGNRNGTSDQ